MNTLSQDLTRLENCVRLRSYESIETDGLEIKSVPPTGKEWKSIRESICAFLNARGGAVVLGVREESRPHRHFVFTGYTEQHSGNLSQLRRTFTDRRGGELDVSDCLQVEVIGFAEGQIALIRVSALSEDRKFCFHEGVAFERIADRDERIEPRRVEEQEERKREMETFRELRPVEGVGLVGLSLERINELILLINRGRSQPIETIKSTLADAASFLEKRRFMLKDGSITTLGVLVCALHPEEHLLFRSSLDAFVDVPAIVAQDKKTFRDNILQLMEAAHGWTLRNIMTGVSAASSGTEVVEYPESLIRECINNALAHRDYSINRPVQLTIKPQASLSIRNPGNMPAELVFENRKHPIQVLTIFANPLARNPRLAEFLKLHNRLEGKGIGMSELVNHALANQIDVPFFLFHSADELSLTIQKGRVLDEAAEAWFDLVGGFIDQMTNSRALTSEQRTVLAYLLKCERLNRLGRYTLALTPSNNHFNAISELTQYGLIALHPESETYRSVYVVCRELATEDCFSELRQLFKGSLEQQDELGQQTLNMIALAERFSRSGGLNAKQVSRLLEQRLPTEYRARGADEFYRAIRYRVERFAPDKRSIDLTSPAWHSVPDRMLAIRGPSNRPTFRLNRDFQPGLFS